MLRAIFRVIFWILALLCLAMGLFRFAAHQREAFDAKDLLPRNGIFTDTTHGQLHSIEIGPEDGPPVVLVHGSVGWAGLWLEVMEALAAKGYRAIAIDLPPMGLSERSNVTDYSRQAQGLRLLAFVEARGLKPTLVAHSFGAGAAMEALIADPGAFAGGVVIAGALALGQDGAGRDLPLPLRSEILREVAVANTVTNPWLTRMLFAQFVHRTEAITEEEVRLVQYPFNRQGTTDTLARWLPTLLVPPRGASSSDPAKYRLDLPMALIWGREDHVTPPDQADTLQAALGEAPIFWLEDVGHIPQVEDPETFIARLLDALALTAPPVTPEN